MDKTYRTIPTTLLKEKVSSPAYNLRITLGDFVFDKPQFEATLGPCEDRPIYTSSTGNIYLG